jgi:hypothetical protein
MILDMRSLRRRGARATNLRWWLQNSQYVCSHHYTTPKAAWNAALRPQPAGGVGAEPPTSGGSGGSSPRADTVDLIAAYSNTSRW